jgi:hypothetical protein
MDHAIDGKVAGRIRRVVRITKQLSAVSFQLSAAAFGFRWLSLFH